MKNSSNILLCVVIFIFKGGKMNIKAIDTIQNWEVNICTKH